MEEIFLLNGIFTEQLEEEGVMGGQACCAWVARVCVWSGGGGG